MTVQTLFSKAFLGGLVPTCETEADKARIALTLLLIFAFLLGGSARDDLAQLVVLRPVTAVFLGYGLYGLKASTVRQHKFLFAMAAGIVALPLMQLVPLPPTFWRDLPGRDLVAQIDSVAGLGAQWRPLTLTPIETRNALFSTMGPLAVLVLGTKLDEERRARLLPVMLALGCISAGLGLLQWGGSESSALYLYPISNFGSPVGLFANRNHQALLLAVMMPMFLVWAVQDSAAVKVLAAVSVCLLLAMIVMIGSRAGLIAAALAVLVSPLLQPLGGFCGMAGTGARKLVVILASSMVLVTSVSVGTAMWLGRSEAWNRLVGQSGEVDLRLSVLPTLAELTRKYFPFGSGLGSFERVYLIAEPDALLNPNYVNHAHNDWLETVLTGGALAATLILSSVVVFGIQAWRNLQANVPLNPNRRLARLGLLVVFLMALGSVVDYPLRTPALAAFFSVAVLWSSCAPTKSGLAKLVD